MLNHAIILEKSLLSANIYRAILESHNVMAETVTNMEDIDVLLREANFRYIVVGEESFDETRWKALVKRNPEIAAIKKIFVTMSKDLEKINGFDLITRPFSTQEFVNICLSRGGNVVAKKNSLAPAPEQVNNRRIFERKSFNTKMFLVDEKQRPVIYLWGRDISLGGLYLENDIKFKRGSLLLISFIYSGKNINVTAQVVRSDKNGVGVRFLGLPDGFTF
jgi:hypothetical protein